MFCCLHPRICICLAITDYNVSIGGGVGVGGGGSDSVWLLHLTIDWLYVVQLNLMIISVGCHAHCWSIVIAVHLLAILTTLGRSVFRSF